MATKSMAPLASEKESSSNTRVLVVGGTGYLGRRMVEASLAAGHPTLVLQRPEIGLAIEKLQMLLSFKARGVTLVEASLSDHDALVAAVRRADVVISTVSGVHIRSHHILAQLNLVKAMKEAGNVKRFIPSEFGIDPSRMADAMEPGKVTFDDKMTVRKAVEDAGIPFTYISAGCFAGYFVGGLCQPGRISPQRDAVQLLGDGSVKATFADEDDISQYTIKTINDPRTLNKSIYIRPPENILSQLDVVRMWERLIGKELKKIPMSEEEFLTIIKALATPSALLPCHAARCTTPLLSPTAVRPSPLLHHTVVDSCMSPCHTATPHAACLLATLPCPCPLPAPCPCTPPYLTPPAHAAAILYQPSRRPHTCTPPVLCNSYLLFCLFSL